MIYGLFPVFVLIAGLLLWSWGPGEPNAPVKTIGKIMVACGIGSLCLAFAEHLVRLL